MREDYRASRVALSDEMKDAVFDLIIKNNDIETKKKYPSKWYRAETAKKLKLAENANSSLRSYEDLISKYRNYLKQRNPLDEPWSYGSLVKYPIPQDKYIEVWRLCEKIRTGWTREIPGLSGGTVTDIFYTNLGLYGLKWLTIRQVRWFIIFRSIPSGLTKANFPNTDPNEMHIRTAIRIALYYARLEQQAEIAKKSLITNTGDSDTLKNIYTKNPISTWADDYWLKNG